MASFNKAFAAARKELGAGKTFTWQGKSYSTNIAGEGKTPKAKGFSVDMAKSAIDKAVGVQTPTAKTPRPMARPVDKTPTPVAAPVKITTTKLKPVATTKVAGRPEGKAAGMPQNKSIKHYEGLIKSGVGSASEIRSAKAILARLRDAAGMPKTTIKPKYTGTMTKAMKNYEAILNSSTASASEKRSAKAALASLQGLE